MVRGALGYWWGRWRSSPLGAAGFRKSALDGLFRGPWTGRCDLSFSRTRIGINGLAEGVDGYVPYAGSLYDNVSVTLAKIKATMISCGSTSLRQFHESARLVEVSHQSRLQNTEDVSLRSAPRKPPLTSVLH